MERRRHVHEGRVRRFGVEIVTTNPSPSPHFEIVIAGSPTNLGLSSGIGGISPFSCQQYIPNSLVFAFANISIYRNDVDEICATAAQEIAHSFALDHVIDPSDPLTYFELQRSPSVQGRADRVR